MHNSTVSFQALLGEYSGRYLMLVLGIIGQGLLTHQWVFVGQFVITTYLRTCQ